MRILLADDESGFRSFMVDLIERLFNDEDVEIFEASDGAEAIELYSKLHDEGTDVDIVITDFAMPIVNGSGVIDHVINTKPVPIIVASAAQEAFERNFVQEGALFFLQKPFDVKTFREVVELSMGLKILPNDIKLAKEAIEKLSKLDK